MLNSSDLELLETRTAQEVLEFALKSRMPSLACLTCSFQAEDIIVLDLLRKRFPKIPVLFLETGYLVNVTPKKTVAQQESEFGILYRNEPTKCCQLRKVEPLMEALEPFEIWFTGLRREQSPTRKNLRKAEDHRLPSGKTVLKVSPLADWTWAEVWEYTGANRLKYLPQYDQGYASIGCEPCTALPDDPTNPRSGRWGGKKLECGIHTFSERAQ
jgi:phosphoadenosine phosphosulfate reductase